MKNGGSILKSNDSNCLRLSETSPYAHPAPARNGIRRSLSLRVGMCEQGLMENVILAR